MPQLAGPHRHRHLITQTGFSDNSLTPETPFPLMPGSQLCPKLHHSRARAEVVPAEPSLLTRLLGWTMLCLP